MTKKSQGPGIVSVLTLDRLGLTKKVVRSIFQNKEGDVKLVFFDNGSTDGTLDYLAKLKEKYPSDIDFLKSETNLGVAAGRNRVFRHVISKYGNNFKWILNLDNDCVVHKGFDTAITKCFEETGALAVCPRLIQPDNRIFYNARDGFLINLEDMELKLEYADSVSIQYDDPGVSKRGTTDVILGTSAKTPAFLDKIGFYDEGHKIGWEDFSIALKALGLKKEHFYKWKKENKHGGKKWVPLRELIDKKQTPEAVVVYEPECMITHDHPVTEEHQEYEKTRWCTKTITESTNHFQRVWGLKPIL